MLLNLFILLYLAGYLVFTVWARFGTPFWDDFFWVWQNIAYGSMFTWAVLLVTLHGEDRKKVKWVFGFSALMFLWQCISTAFRIDINYSPAVFIAFLACVFVCTVLGLNLHSKIFKSKKTFKKE